MVDSAMGSFERVVLALQRGCSVQNVTTVYMTFLELSRVGGVEGVQCTNSVCSRSDLPGILPPEMLMQSPRMEVDFSS